MQRDTIVYGRGRFILFYSSSALIEIYSNWRWKSSHCRISISRIGIALLLLVLNSVLPHWSTEFLRNSNYIYILVAVRKVKLFNWRPLGMLSIFNSNLSGSYFYYKVWQCICIGAEFSFSLNKISSKSISNNKFISRHYFGSSLQIHLEILNIVTASLCIAPKYSLFFLFIVAFLQFAKV